MLSVGIIGASRFGTGIAHELTRLGHKVMIMDMDAVIVAIDDQETYANIATMNCKDLDLFVVARALHAGHGKILERLGADLVVTPEYDAGLRIARLLAQPSILDMIELYAEVFMMELQADGQLVNRSLSDLNLPLRCGVQIVLIQRDLHTIFPVTAADIIKQGDKLICIGSSDNLNLVAKMCQEPAIQEPTIL